MSTNETTPAPEPAPKAGGTPAPEPAPKADSKAARNSGASLSRQSSEDVRVIVRAGLAAGTVLGFFSIVVILLRMIASGQSRQYPPEYWLFLGNVVGILGTLTVNALSFYFGSSDSGGSDSNRSR